MDLAGVQDAVRDVNPNYVNMLTWTMDHGIIKAVPKRRLSDLAYRSILKVFQHLEGGYVSHLDQAWFELVLEEFRVSPLADVSHKAPQGKARLTSPLQGSVLTQTEVRIASLIHAAHVLLEEA